MKNSLYLGALALAIGVFASACNVCEGGSVCGRDILFAPSGSPTPTPKPGATPDPCVVKSITVGFKSGAQLPFVALGAIEQLDATPFNDGGETPKGCNVVREPVWTVLTPTTCQILSSDNPYNPFLRGLRVGTCSVTATLTSDNRQIVSSPFSVEVR